jgi:hypothetical protein
MEVSNAKLLKRIFDFADARDLDKHAVAIATLWMTYFVVKWSMHFAELNAEKAGLDIAAVLAAINAPYMALQGAVIRFYFNSRPDTPLS